MASVYSLAGNDFAFNRRLQPYRIGKPWRCGTQLIRIAAQPHSVYGAGSALTILDEDTTGAGKQFSKKEVEVNHLDVASVAVVIGELLPLTIHNLLYQAPTTRVCDFDAETSVPPHFIIPTRADTHLVVALLSPRKKDPPGRGLYALHWKYDDVCLSVRLPPCCCDSVFWYAEWCIDVKGSPGEREKQWYANIDSILDELLVKNPFSFTGIMPPLLQGQSEKPSSTQAGQQSTTPVGQQPRTQPGKQSQISQPEAQNSRLWPQNTHPIQQQGAQLLLQNTIDIGEQEVQQQQQQQQKRQKGQKHLWQQQNTQFEDQSDQLWRSILQSGEQSNNQLWPQKNTQLGQQQMVRTGEQSDHRPWQQKQQNIQFGDQNNQIWQQNAQLGDPSGLLWQGDAQYGQQMPQSGGQDEQQMWQQHSQAVEQGTNQPNKRKRSDLADGHDSCRTS